MRFLNQTLLTGLMLLGMCSTLSAAPLDVNCHKPRNFAERTICSEAAFSEANAKLSELHQKAQGKSKDSAFFNKMVQENLRVRSACRTEDCLTLWNLNVEMQYRRIIDPSFTPQSAVRLSGVLVKDTITDPLKSNGSKVSYLAILSDKVVAKKDPELGEQTTELLQIIAMDKGTLSALEQQIGSEIQADCAELVLAHSAHYLTPILCNHPFNIRYGKKVDAAQLSSRLTKAREALW